MPKAKKIVVKTPALTREESWRLGQVRFGRTIVRANDWCEEKGLSFRSEYLLLSLEDGKDPVSSFVQEESLRDEEKRFYEVVFPGERTVFNSQQFVRNFPVVSKKG